MDNPKKPDPFAALWTQAKVQTRNEIAAKKPPSALDLASREYLQKAKAGPRGGITADALQQQLGKLKKVTEVNTPFASNLTIKRDGPHTGLTPHTAHGFADFVVQTRRDLTQIAQTTAGQDLFKAIESRKQHKVSIQDAGPAEGIRESELPASIHGVRTTANLLGSPLDWPNIGASTTVSHHTDIAERWAKPIAQAQGLSAKQIEGVGISASLALGHELIHAARTVTGWGTNAPKVGGVKPEERETVGSADAKRNHPQIPTENELRRDLNAQVFSGSGVVKTIKPRKKYSGHDL